MIAWRNLESQGLGVPLRGHALVPDLVAHALAGTTPEALAPVAAALVIATQCLDRDLTRDRDRDQAQAQLGLQMGRLQTGPRFGFAPSTKIVSSLPPVMLAVTRATC